MRAPRLGRASVSLRVNSTNGAAKSSVGSGAQAHQGKPRTPLGLWGPTMGEWDDFVEQVPWKKYASALYSRL